MERRINRKIEDYISSFKDELRNKISSLDIDDKEKAQLLVQIEPPNKKVAVPAA